MMIEKLPKGNGNDALIDVINALSGRVSALEDFVDDVLSAGTDAEEEFVEERQQWIDKCRERAAEKRRTS